MDGTFKCCTKFFYQLYTIHGYKNGQYVPLVFALLPRKECKVYKQLLILVIQQRTFFNLVWQPKTTIIDFEQAVNKIIRELFPQSKVIGCLLHLKQAWYRKIKTLGLSKEFS